MVSLSVGTFRCVLLTPLGKLLDCKAGSLIAPGDDGLLGILRNHAPMLCKLAQGIVQVRGIVGAEDAYYLIDGGFLRVSENHATILAHDVTTFEGMAESDIKTILSDARQAVVGGAYMQTQTGGSDLQRAKLLVKLGQMAGIITE